MLPVIRTSPPPLRFRSRVPRPRLDPLDPGYAPIEFQFTPQSFTRGASAVWAEEPGFGRDHPVLQFVAREADTYRFTAMFFAESAANTIHGVVAALLDTVKRDPQLNRPPLWSLTWGDFLVDDSVVVESVGGLEYGDPRPDAGLNVRDRIGPDRPGTGGGGLRSVTAQIQLRHYEPFGVEVVSPTDQEHDTFYHRVRTGDTWEGLAAKHYGDARKGEFLRRRNPGKEFLTVGDTVAILRPERFRGLVPTPYSIPLMRTAAAATMRAGHFERLGRPRVKHALPEGL